MSRATIDTGAEGAGTNKAEPLACPLHPNRIANDTETADGTDTSRVGDAPNIADVVRQLKAKLENYHHKRAQQAGWSRRFVPTGLTPLDAVLPHNGLPCGVIIEIFSDGLGVGSMALTMRIADRCIRCGRHSNMAELSYSDPGHVEWMPPITAQVHSRKADETRPAEPSTIPPSRREKDLPVVPPYQGGKEGGSTDHRYIVLIDTTKDFYPPATWQYGLTLTRLVVIRPTTEKEAFWATEQVLRCSGVAVVIASLTNLEEHLSRRLQLAAESSGCIGLLLRSTSRRVKSFAAIQMLVEGAGNPKLQAHTQIVDRAAGLNPRGRSQFHTASQITDIPHRLKSKMCPGVPTARHEVSASLTTDDVRLCRITLLKVREGMPTEPLLVDLHHETGTWPLHPIPVDRPATKLA